MLAKELSPQSMDQKFQASCPQSCPQRLGLHVLSGVQERQQNREAVSSKAEESAMFARKAMEQVHKLRQEKAEEVQRLKEEKALSWNQKVRERGRGDSHTACCCIHASTSSLAGCRAKNAGIAQSQLPAAQVLTVECCTVCFACGFACSEGGLGVRHNCD